MSTTASRLAVLLFTDIVGSTDLKTRIGAPAYAALLDRHNTIFETICADQHGQVLKHTGDGFFAAFTTASDAVRAALRFQQAMRSETWSTPVTSRVGIHVGEVVDVQMAGRSDVIGVAADVAAQVMSLAAGGQILLTRSAFNDARQFVAEHPAVDGQPRPPLRWVAHGPYLFNGIDESVEVFEVGADGAAPLSAPGGGGKARRVVPHDQEPTLGWRPAIGLPIPQRPGRALEKRLGEGGFGEVWLGLHDRTKQHRVFKFCFDADRLRSFKREMTLFRLLREALGERPDIARLYEVQLDEPPFFLESEWTEGGNLVDWSEARGGITTVPLDQRLEIVAKVADAVAAAHSVGILHKDIKPSNVLVQELPDKTIQPRLADFGIGFLADRSQLAARHITETGFTVITQTSGSSMTGTRLYSPPEVLAGKPFTTHGDIYALGVMLYQMAVGDLHRPLAEGWERDAPDELIRQDIAACCDGDPNRRPGGGGEIAQRIRALPQRREAQREQALNAQVAQRRQRVLRRSIAGSVLMGLLVLTIAASSAFYIRRVRAAQRAETEQRQRAEGAEKAARESAAAAQAQAEHAARLAAYYNAQYLLGRGLVKDAWEKATIANVPPARWEDGHLLQQIVNAARGSWEVIGQIDDPTLLFESGPGMGCFVSTGKDQWVLLIPRGRSVESYTVPQCAHLGTIRCGTLVGPICQAPGNGRALISSARTVMLWDVTSMKQLATAEEQDTVAQIAARPEAAAIATLDQAGHVTVRSATDLHLLASHQIQIHPQATGAGAPNIDLSPSGKRIVAQTGVWREGLVVWDWERDQSSTHALTSHQTVFLDDQTLLGYWNWGYGLDESQVVSLSLGRPDANPQYMNMRNLQGKTSAQMDFYRNARGEARVAIKSKEALDVRGYPDGEMVISTLYSSLLPLTPRNRTVTAVAQDLGNGLLALKGEQIIVLRGPLRKSEKTMAGWSMSVCDRGMFTCELMQDEAFHPWGSLTLTPFSGAADQNFRLEWPTPEGKKVLPWGIWSPPDGSFVAVLRQETEPNGGGSIGSRYFNKSIAVYDTAGWRAAPEVWKIKTQFPLPQFDGVDARNHRWLCVTPDAKVALFCTYAAIGTRYSVPDGKMLGELNLGRWATPSQDGRFVAGGGIGNQPVKVWDISSGSVVFTTPDVGYARRACFSSDGKLLCVGWGSGSGARMVWYDLATGERTRTLTTTLLPVAVPASGDRIAAFMPDTSVTGKLVLASITDAEVTDMLNQGSHIQNTAWFDPSGKRLALVTFRDKAEVAAALTLEEARAVLDPRTEVPVQAATATTATTAPTVVAKMPQVVASTTKPGLVAWQDAGAYVGQHVTVEAQVIRTRNIGSRCFLNVTPNRDLSFLIVLNPSTFDKWPDVPEKWFLDKKVRVSGTIDLYRGAPEIIVDDPKQIEVVEPE